MNDWIYGFISSLGLLVPIYLFIEVRRKQRENNKKVEATWHGDLSKDDGVYPSEPLDSGEIHKSMEVARAIAQRSNPNLVDDKKFWGIVSNFNFNETNYLFETIVMAYFTLGHRELAKQLQETFKKYAETGITNRRKL
jgi:hypothetical protein